MVARSHTGGHHPIHVQRKVSTMATAQHLLCEWPACQEAARTYGRGNITSYTCPHLNSVNFAEGEDHQLQVTADTVDKMIVEEKVIKESSRQILMEVIERCHSSGRPASIMWQPNPASSLFFVSVVASKHSRYALLGRVVVTIDTHKLTIKCPCMKTRQSCINAKMAIEA